MRLSKRCGATIDGRKRKAYDDLVAAQAAKPLDAGLLLLATTRQTRRQRLLDAGIPPTNLLADAHAIGIETRFGRRRIVAQYVCRNGTIEILEQEARSNRLLRSLLAQGPLPTTGVRDVARAINITDLELESAMRRLGVIERRTARTGRTLLELHDLDDADPPSRELPGCGHPTIWRGENGPWRCTTCHPPALRRLVHETAASHSSARAASSYRNNEPGATRAAETVSPLAPFR